MNPRIHRGSPSGRRDGSPNPYPISLMDPRTHRGGGLDGRDGFPNPSRGGWLGLMDSLVRATAGPTVLSRLSLDRAFGVDSRVRLLLHPNWSQPDREFDLANRQRGGRVHEIVMRGGTDGDIDRYIDGALLIDLWPDLVLPANLRREWQPLMEMDPSAKPTRNPAVGG
jgi:hypothetical protein